MPLYIVGNVPERKLAKGELQGFSQS
ncbi:hypothetical protein CCAND95_580003 [Capnocytophaga canis]|uniref:Uncharacterized protein n=1 Tax=Capnocytophaga canis TaxID=1848903 RepID=A0A0B7IDX0_9FLAO|nr:hypothetical protein CCAND38_1030003 [Capnocytophaga canis]CEN45835.1 hypothetical protein CCAND95_580003 [Capnocytophaga canis]CEN50106.1 hypothetical protein CCAND93_1020003 [Capnocytophaga canis]